MSANKHLTQASLLAIAALLTFSEAATAAEKETKPVKPATTVAASAPQEVIAKVNGSPIYAIELKRAQKVIMSGQPNLQVPPERQKEFDTQALNQLISAELLYQAGKKQEIKDIEKLVDDKINQGKTRFSNQQDFEKAIKELDMTEADLREYTRRDLLISTFIQQNIASKVKVSEEDSKKFYEQNQDKFKQEESVRASHILIGVDPKATDEEKKKAKEKAVKLRKDLAAGADFAALAKGNSTCPSSQQGGDLGYFSRGQMVPPFEQAAFTLKPGELSDVVETQFGYHIIKAIDHKKAETVAFKDAKPRIDEFLKNQKTSAAVAEYLTENRKKASVEILLK